jgi:hypothetical protein
MRTRRPFLFALSLCPFSLPFLFALSLCPFSLPFLFALSLTAAFCILSSDLGQRGNALPPDGFGAFLAAMRARGFSEQEIARMSKQNPARLLGLN